jgi:Ca-activated chloride channel family protein
MKFQETIWLWVLPWLVLILWLLYRWSAQRRLASLDKIIAPRLREQLSRSVNYTRRNWKHVLFLIGVAALLAALSRPAMGFREVTVERPGVDLMLAVDLSRSMLATDAKTNRLAAVQQALAEMLGKPSNDRVGLVGFAGEAFLISPITQDHASIQRTVAALTTTAISKPGTDIAAAIKLALKSFDEKQKAGKAVIILTDGEELQGDAVVAARQAAAKGVGIFTVGVGTSLGARIPVSGWGQKQFAKNEFGTEVISRLNERVLQQVAAAGRGYYLALGAEGEGLEDIFERGLKALAKGQQTRLSKDMLDYFQWPLALCLLLLFGEMLLSERRRSGVAPTRIS